MHLPSVISSGIRFYYKDFYVSTNYFLHYPLKNVMLLIYSLFPTLDMQVLVSPFRSLLCIFYTLYFSVNKMDFSFIPSNSFSRYIAIFSTAGESTISSCDPGTEYLFTLPFNKGPQSVNNSFPSSALK